LAGKQAESENGFGLFFLRMKPSDDPVDK